MGSSESEAAPGASGDATSLDANANADADADSTDTRRRDAAGWPSGSLVDARTRLPLWTWAWESCSACDTRDPRSG